MPSSPVKFRSDIEGLRGVAVLAVVIHHLDLGLFPHGYLGVDVFFVISGYVITSSIIDWDWTHFRPAAMRFFARRFKRLAPALLVCLTITSILASLVVYGMEDYVSTAIWAALGVSNVFLYTQQFNYFGSSLELNPFTHTWSLGVEEQFYVLFPVFAWLAFSGAVSSRARSLAVFAVPCLCLTSLAAYVAFAEHDPIGTFYLIHFRAWELGCGAALFFLRPKRMPDGLNGVVLPIGLSLLLCLFAAPGDWHRSVVTIAAVVLTTCVILFPVQRGAVSLVLTNRPLREIGRISYSLYLWHWPVVVLAKWTIGLRPETIPGLVILMLAIAKASHAFIETPLRQVEWRISGIRGFVTGSCGLLLALTVLFALNGPLSYRLYTGEPAPFEQQGYDTLSLPLQAEDGSVWAGAPCILSDKSMIGGSIPIGDCTFGNWKGASKRMLVVGNSFSVSFAGAFRDIADAEGWSVLLTASWDAFPLPEFGYRGFREEINRYYWEDVVPDLVQELRAGDIVLVVSDLAFLSPASSSAALPQIETLAKGIERFSSELSARGVELAIMGPLPLAREAKCAPEVAISQWFAPNGGPCKFMTREETLARHAPLNRALGDLETRGIVINVDLFDEFCPGTLCTYGSRETFVLYRDEWSHPSLEAASAFAGAMARQLGR